MWVKGKIIKNVLGLSNQSLYERRKKGTIKFKNVDGVRFYWLTEIPNEFESLNNFNVLYCRVSNTKQKDDLDRQIKLLTEYAISTGHKVDFIFKDIASGMNDDRPGFNDMLNLIFKNKINKIFVSYKDRLTRFGFNYFENIFKKFNTVIEVVNLTKEEDFQEELTQDLISIIHHFSMKMYSNRRKQLNILKKQLQVNE